MVTPSAKRDPAAAGSVPASGVVPTDSWPMDDHGMRRRAATARRRRCAARGRARVSSAPAAGVLRRESARGRPTSETRPAMMQPSSGRKTIA